MGKHSKNTSFPVIELWAYADSALLVEEADSALHFGEITN
jgi:hypothetical protein